MTAPLPDAVFWDMDGTLLNTERYWIESEHSLVERHGTGWTLEHAHAIVGLDLREAARHLQTYGSVDLPVDTIVHKLLDGVIEGVRSDPLWMPGALELLASLRAATVPCALVTMSWRRLADEVIALIPAGTFAAAIVGDEVSNGKPHPEPYLAAARFLGVDPSRCVAIEDSPTGLRSAEGAGCRTVAVANVVPLGPANRRTLVESLVGITPEWLGELITLAP